SCRHPSACDEEALSDWWHLRSRHLRHTHRSILEGGGPRTSGKRQAPGWGKAPAVKPVGVWGYRRAASERMKRATIPSKKRPSRAVGSQKHGFPAQRVTCRATRCHRPLVRERTEASRP